MTHPTTSLDFASFTRFRRPVAVAALAMAAGVPANATDFDWLGESGNWSDEARWDGSGSPNDPADTASIENNNVPPFTVTLDGDYTINWLFMGTKVGTLVATDRVLAMSGTGSASLQIGTVEWTRSTLSTEAGGSIFLGSGIAFTATGTCLFTSPLVDVDGSLDVVGTGAGGGELIASERLENGGAITLRATAGVAQRIAVTTGPLINEANGLIHNVNIGTEASLDADLIDNRGTLDLDKNTLITRIGGAIDNRGDISVAANRILDMEAGGQLFTQRVGASLENLGAFSLADGRFEFEGGTLTGNPLELTNCELIIATTNAGAFDLFRQTDLTGPIAEAQTVDVVSDAGGTANLVGATGIDNHGTMNTRATASAPKTLTATNGAIVNHPTGLIHAVAIGAGTRIDADLLDNRGTIDLDVNTRLMRADSVLDNHGDISVAVNRNLFLEAGGQLFTQRDGASLDNVGAVVIEDGRFEFEGGTLTGNPLELTNCELIITTTNAGAFDLFRQTDLTGPIAEAQTVDVVSDAGGSANLVGVTGIDNHGTINMRATAAVDKFITATKGSIVNHPTGLIHAMNVGQETRIDAAILDNRGALTVDANTRFDRDNGTVSNRGRMRVAVNRVLFAGTTTFTNEDDGVIDGHGTVNVETADFTNAAFVEPGTSAGRLRFDGLYRQNELGTLVIELGGTGQGTQFDHLLIDGDAELAGNLEIRLIDGFVPTLGQQFTFLTTTGLISGEFENVNCQQVFRLDYTKSSVTITLVQQTCPADLNCSGTVGFNDLLSVLTNWGPYEDCPPYRPSDFDQNCDVGFDDLLVILNAWGPCP